MVQAGVEAVEECQAPLSTAPPACDIWFFEAPLHPPFSRQSSHSSNRLQALSLSAPSPLFSSIWYYWGRPRI